MGSLTLLGGFTPKNVQTFAVLYAIGNVVALMSTGFLMGPKKQCRVMWKPTRFWTTGFYLTMLIVVFSVAVAKFEMQGKVYVPLTLPPAQPCSTKRSVFEIRVAWRYISVRESSSKHAF
jgi:hypothetical protein